MWVDKRRGKEIVPRDCTSVILKPLHDTAEQSEIDAVDIVVVVRLFDSVRRGACRKPSFQGDLTERMVEGRKGKWR